MMLTVLLPIKFVRSVEKQLGFSTVFLLTGSLMMAARKQIIEKEMNTVSCSQLNEMKDTEN